MTQPPDHVEDTVQSVARMHAEHHERATGAERAFAWLVSVIAAPRFVLAAAGVCLAWIAFNLAAPGLHLPAFDPSPFNLLQGLATVAALAVTILILNNQRRDDRIATQREQVALQLAMMNDRKLAKLIKLVEELRRDDPSLRNRHDPEAEALAQPADPQTVLNALDTK